MLKSDLTKPLSGNSGRQTPPPRWRLAIAPVIVSVALVVAVVAALWVAVVDDPDGGRPVAVASIEGAQLAATGSITKSDESRLGAAPEQSGASLPLSGDETQQPASDGEMQLAALPRLPPVVSGDPSLFEQSRYGPLPRVSPDGRRPREAYARRAAPVPEGVPRIVLVIGGLGLSQTGTLNAIEALPEDVTLAFAPYGSSLERWVAKSRETGHEVLLQVPLEPMNYPQDNPGEHTLLTESGAANRDNLHWVLGRMSAYAGVMNHMGARFLQDERVVVPFLGEIGERGLFYLDDGTTPQSLAASVGPALRVPVVTADRVLDRVRTEAAIEGELGGLEAIARARGLAVGVASAFPVSVETIARWARNAQARGIVIIPASAAIDS